MSSEIAQANAAVIRREIEWFHTVLEARFRQHAGEAEALVPLAEPPPDLPETGSPYADALRRFKLGVPERLLLILACLPHIQPDALDPFLLQSQAMQRRFFAFGGLTGSAATGLLPTVEAAMFLLAGNDLETRLRYQTLLHPDHAFYTKDILQLIVRSPEEPVLSAALCLSRTYAGVLISGAAPQPPLSPAFPAQRITTALTWGDLVLDQPTREDVAEIAAWLQHKERLLTGWGLAKRLKPGFRSLFYGPPGTGKTLTATLIGQQVNQPVYRIDLSRLLSQHIEETGKTLTILFDFARNRDWILFFDEAASLFGKLTGSPNAADLTANPHVSCLLQRIEDFPGLIIMASTQRTHPDETLTRRCQSVTLFPMPDPDQRFQLWRNLLHDQKLQLAPDVGLRQIANSYELSGGGITNVLRSACLKAVVREPPMVTTEDLLSGIRMELRKDGRTAP